MSYLWNGSPGQRIHIPTVNQTHKFSLLVRFNPTTQGAGHSGAIANRQDKNPSLLFDGVAGSKKLMWQWFYTGADGKWRLTQTARVPGWNTLATSWDGTLAANNPLVVLNGAQATLTRNPSATGSPEGNLVSINIGWANAVGVYVGQIGEYAIWTNTLFTLAELLEISFKGPLARPRGLAVWWRNGVQLTKDLSGHARHGTRAATTVGQEPVWTSELGSPAYPVGVA